MKSLLLSASLCLVSVVLSSCIRYDCEPNCVGRDCGDDGCGGSCGTCLSIDECFVSVCADGNCLDVPKELEVLRCADAFNIEVCINGERWIAGCPGWCELEEHTATSGCDEETSECVCADFERTCVPGLSQCRDGRFLWWCEIPEYAATEGNFWILYDCLAVCEQGGGTLEYCGFWEESSQDLCLCSEG